MKQTNIHDIGSLLSRAYIIYDYISFHSDFIYFVL